MKVFGGILFILVGGFVWIQTSAGYNTCHSLAGPFIPASDCNTVTLWHDAGIVTTVIGFAFIVWAIFSAARNSQK